MWVHQESRTLNLCRTYNICTIDFTLFCIFLREIRCSMEFRSLRLYIDYIETCTQFVTLTYYI